MAGRKNLVAGLFLLVAGIIIFLSEETFRFPVHILLGEIILGAGCVVIIAGLIDLKLPKKNANQ